MRDNNKPRVTPVPTLGRRSSESSNDIQSLRAQLKSLKQQTETKKLQLFDMNIKLRSQGVKNQKLKKQVLEIDDKCNQFMSNQVEYLYQLHKDNKQSPLFYNENGLSPFQLVRIGQSKHEDTSENLICMICYHDLQKGSKIMTLPCSHKLHKQCGIQHLLYCKQCPACQEDIK